MKTRIATALADVFKRIETGEKPPEAIAAVAEQHGLGQRWVDDTRQYVETQLCWQETNLGGVGK